jgi:hypothetical protein
MMTHINALTELRGNTATIRWRFTHEADAHIRFTDLPQPSVWIIHAKRHPEAGRGPG